MTNPPPKTLTPEIVVSWHAPLSPETTFPCPTKNTFDKERSLANTLNLPLRDPNTLEPQQYVLAFHQGRLELSLPASAPARPRMKIYTEFVKGPIGYRLKKGGGFNQLIAKALGLKGRKEPPCVIDATAGLGQDGVILASLGCSILLIERSVIIASLLKDGLERAFSEPSLARLQERIRLQVGEAKEVMLALSPCDFPEIIYLDPMFPMKPKNALAKIEMRVLHAMVGRDEDAEELFNMALKIAKERVVVKRPLRAPTLSSKIHPHFQVLGRSTRYDVYLTQR